MPQGHRRLGRPCFSEGRNNVITEKFKVAHYRNLRPLGPASMHDVRRHNLRLSQSGDELLVGLRQESLLRVVVPDDGS